MRTEKRAVALAALALCFFAWGCAPASDVEMAKEAAPPAETAPDPQGMSEMMVEQACPADELAAFPIDWPEPTTTADFPPSAFTRGGTVYDVAASLGQALRRAQYPEPLFLGYGCEGVAVAANFEAIDRSGKRKPAPDGFPERAPDALAPGNPIDFLVGLFYARPGFHRQIVFLVSSEFGVSTGQTVSEGELLEIVEPGSVTLPLSYRSATLTPEHRVRALIYEFELKQGAGAADPIRGKGQPPIGLLPARDHLAAAGVLRTRAR